MPSLFIKEFPPEIHGWLKNEAMRNRRSMTQQAIAFFEAAQFNSVKPVRALSNTRQFALKRPVDSAWVAAAIREGRDS